jgi:hypothetical protein
MTRENAMSKQTSTARLLAAALLSGGLATGAMFVTSRTLAQTTSPAPAAPAAPAAAPAPAAATPLRAGSMPLADVPFYAEWASSPHANHKAEAFNHWNKEGAIPVTCARCHSTPGFRDYIGADGTAAGVVDHPAPVGTVITCNACHNSKTRALTSVTFPSGFKAENQGADARCMTCHQGVESTVSVNKATANIADDKVEPKLVFINVHYRAAGATLFGHLARGAYEYPGKSYGGRFQHRAPYTHCTACHELHTVAVKVNDCAACHKEVTDKASLHRIRVSKSDFDGNGDANEGIAQEVEHQRAKLLAAITAYAKGTARKPIVYDLDVYPYFFIDTNGNGIADKAEARFPNKYNAWTPRLLKAAYNYQFVTKDPGAFAHNPVYTLQILHDSIADLGAKVTVDLSKAKRP